MTTEQRQGRARSKLRRFLAQFWRIGLGLIMGQIAFALTYSEYSPDSAVDVRAVGSLIFLDILGGIVALVLYPLRHRFPVVMAASLVLLSIPSTLAMPFAGLAMVSLATRRRMWEILGIGTLFVLGIFASEALFGAVLPMPEEVITWWQTLIVGIVLVGPTMLIGMYIGGKRQLADSLLEQTRSAQRERQAQIHAAKADERTRIAREMHDVLAHRLSLVALHSGALEIRQDLSPEQTRATAGIIRENSRLALGELREVLGTLRDPGTLFDNELARPQPTLGELNQVIAESRAVGTEVEVVMSQATSDRLPSLAQSTGRHLYRIIQETLTNARRHAPGEPVIMEIAGGAEDQLLLRVSNRLLAGLRGQRPPAGAPAAGLGLTGVTERARLAGGDVLIDMKNDDEFVVKVWLPW